jgi:hypothetical protein
VKWSSTLPCNLKTEAPLKEIGDRLLDYTESHHGRHFS